MFSKHCIIVKGGGDLATAVAHKLFRSGFPVIITELENPKMVRRTVAFANCVYEKEWTVEGVTSVLTNEEGVDQIIRDGRVPVVIDPSCNICKNKKPTVMHGAFFLN